MSARKKINLSDHRKISIYKMGEEEKEQLVGSYLYKHLNELKSRNISNKDACYKLYIHIVPKEINSEHERDKYYVGITGQKLHERWGRGSGYKGNSLFYRAISKHGWDSIKHCLIADHLLKQDAKECEVALIARLHSNNRKYGYNITCGGDNMIGHKRIAVKQYTMNNVFVRSWNDYWDAANYYYEIGKSYNLESSRQNIYFALLGKQKTAFKHKWVMEGHEAPTSDSKIMNTQKTVYVYTRNGFFVEKFDSPLEASRITNTSPNLVRRCVEGWSKSANGYIFTYDSNFKIDGYFCKPSHKTISIVQIDRDLNVVNEYPSISSAVIATNITKDAISRCAKFNHNASDEKLYSCGFMWIYKEDYEKEKANYKQIRSVPNSNIY